MAEKPITPYESAAAQLADAAIHLERARLEAADRRREAQRAETAAANARCTWESKRDALLKIIDEQGKG